MIRRLKSTLHIGLLIIIFGIIVYGLSTKVKPVKEREQPMINSTNITPIEIKLTLRDSIVIFGMELLGTPYVAGASNKNGFDCSGFVFYVYKHFKIQVPRSSSQFIKFGKEISIDKVKKGDILVFKSPTRNVIGHVGIVTIANGMDSEFIHASTGREMKVILSNLKQEAYKHRFVKAVDAL